MAHPWLRGVEQVICLFSLHSTNYVDCKIDLKSTAVNHEATRLPPSIHITHPSGTSFAGHNRRRPLGAGGDQAAAPCVDPAFMSRRAS